MDINSYDISENFGIFILKNKLVVNLLISCFVNFDFDNKALS